MEWKNLWRGLIMGISDLIPGVSGGTLAVVLGIYDRLMDAISGIFSHEWKRHLSFLLPLGVGIVTAIFSLSSVMDFLLRTYPQQTYFLFIGLIFGVLPFLWREVNAKQTFQLKHYGLLLIGFTIVMVLGLFQPEEGAAPTSLALSSEEYMTLFLAGWLASTALVLPGISGSFILLLIGLYPTVILAVKTLYIPVIATIGIGLVIGILLTSRVMRYLLHHYHTATYSIIIGLVLGSGVVIFPGLSGGVLAISGSFISLLVGLMIAIGLGRLGR
ncbi:DUF368 domain-containing protein [Bacillaceae bacterium SIJ1]|uniref:DUF368 domain-containing protein n=1 Tax=Litoribacterium kuwaitense TaxID=1398745 RepID=UPI0013EC5C81|nr:DUF368 domain-containing protein [Litoribacterium kuwaitense]NGP46520.1 DUF368 domain-containing protein [Litoribacterium kuwaitense]